MKVDHKYQFVLLFTVYISFIHYMAGYDGAVYANKS